MVRDMTRFYGISIGAMFLGVLAGVVLFRSCNRVVPAVKPATDAAALVQTWNFLHDSARSLSFGERAGTIRDRIVYVDREVPGHPVRISGETPATIVRSMSVDSRTITLDVGVGDTVVRHAIPIPRIGETTIVGIPVANDPNRSTILSREKRFSFAFRPAIGGAITFDRADIAGSVSLVSWNPRDVTLDAFATPRGVGPGISWAPSRRSNIRLGYGVSVWPEPVHGIYAVVDIIR